MPREAIAAVLRVVRTPAGTDAAFVALCYLVNLESRGFIPLVLAAAAGLAIYWIGLVGWVFIDARAQRENAAVWERSPTCWPRGSRRGTSLKELRTWGHCRKAAPNRLLRPPIGVHDSPSITALGRGPE
jgi:hypothetical protein